LSNEAGGWVISCENSSISQSNLGVSVATGAADGRAFGGRISALLASSATASSACRR
jgi:hypothetical protein